MEQEYLQELFSFQAELQFSNDAGLFEMEPTEEGAKTLSSYGLYFKPMDNGFTVAAPFIGHPDAGLMELKNQFDDDVKLSLQTNNSLYPFQPEKVKVMNLDPITFTSAQAIDTPNETLAVSLYRQNWNGDCRWTSPKYKDCNQDYWIEFDNEYWCRYKDYFGSYKYKCPARCTDELIGQLPKPGEVYTKYYVEDGKQYAQMILYLVKENYQYVLKPTYEPAGEFTYKIWG